MSFKLLKILCLIPARKGSSLKNKNIRSYKDEPLIFHTIKTALKSNLINKIDVLLDDRNDRAGVKFKDAELIGIPFQIIIGRDSINREVELLCRTNNTKLKISTDKLLETFISESEIMYNKKS